MGAVSMGIVSGSRSIGAAELDGRVRRVAAGLCCARGGPRPMRRHPDAQRHRLHGGGLRGADAGRLRGADQLALQGRGDRLHSRRLRHPRAGRPRRPARADCRRPAARDCARSPCPRRRRWQRPMASRRCRRARWPARTSTRHGLPRQVRLRGRDAHAVAHHVLHLRHDRPPQGRAPSGAGPGADGRDRTHAPRHLRHRAGHPLRRAGAALSLRAQCLCHARRPRRRRDGADAALRSGRIAGADRARAPRHHVHGADHVHPPAEAARGGAAPLRHLLAASSSSTPRRPARPRSSGR